MTNFKKCLYEDAINDEHKSIIDKVYPKLFSVKEDKNPFFKESFLNFQPDVLKIVIKDIKKEDLDRLIYKIIAEKKNSPMTIYSIWNALNRNQQERYYNRVFEILKDNPECKFEVWNTSKFDSNNKKKKVKEILLQIKNEEDIKKQEGKIRKIIKGKSKKARKMNLDIEL